eukprot:CAMPEP_0116901276 /NCGR_PEP_ID=MMETSP0467-20121206/9248_1 /TAXON_ID=283647 /ORGANISM="Mesodinium pulex, Strain SPMC105" /LENGTH=76 /DNA_ID=CAMNT_0004574741 /DNA_START=409 /DNA_END=636 /DNA_ORIENTATION=-
MTPSKSATRLKEFVSGVRDRGDRGDREKNTSRICDSLDNEDNVSNSYDIIVLKFKCAFKNINYNLLMVLNNSLKKW